MAFVCLVIEGHLERYQDILVVSTWGRGVTLVSNIRNDAKRAMMNWTVSHNKELSESKTVNSAAVEKRCSSFRHWIGLTCVTNKILWKWWCMTFKPRSQKIVWLLSCSLLYCLLWGKPVATLWRNLHSHIDKPRSLLQEMQVIHLGQGSLTPSEAFNWLHPQPSRWQIREIP